MSEIKVATNDEVESKINDDNSIILDVREPGEFALKHVPNSILIPLGELDRRLEELDKNKTIYVICRTGNRSGYAVQYMMSQGFNDIYNVLPGMINWTGATDTKF